MFRLTIYVGPYIGRLIETSLLEVNDGIIESAQAMGASPMQIITKFVLPESRSSLILNLTTATISLIGATAMAGAVGAAVSVTLPFLMVINVLIVA